MRGAQDSALTRLLYRSLLRACGRGAHPECFDWASFCSGTRPSQLPASSGEVVDHIRRHFVAPEDASPEVFAALRRASTLSRALRPDVASLPASLPAFVLPSHTLLSGERAQFIFLCARDPNTRYHYLAPSHRDHAEIGDPSCTLRAQRATVPPARTARSLRPRGPRRGWPLRPSARHVDARRPRHDNNNGQLGGNFRGGCGAGAARDARDDPTARATPRRPLRRRVPRGATCRNHQRARGGTSRAPTNTGSRPAAAPGIPYRP